MITITSEYLDANWKALVDTFVLPTQFSEWDAGDAYTLSSIGIMPSQKVAFGAVVLEDAKVSDFPIVIRLRKAFGNARANVYQCPDGIRYEATAERVVDGVTKSIPVHVESIAKSISARRRGLLETDLLKDRSVLIVGLGTGGITVALELAKAGVGKFVLVDPGRLEIGNVSRHSAGISFVGRKKVTAARDLILETNPQALVACHGMEANEDSEDLIQTLIESCHLVICATDSRPSKLFINALCVDAKKRVIFGGAFRRAYGGQVLRVRPGESACFHCFVLTMPEKEADREISSQENADSIAYSDTLVPIEPGLSMDVAPIAIMVSKLALQELIVGEESSFHILDKDFEAGWYLWINRPEPNTEYALWPPLSDSFDEKTILRWYGIYLEKDSGCPTCGDFEKAIREEYGLEPGTGSLPTQPAPSIGKHN